MASYFTSLNGNGSDSLTVKPYSISIINHSVSLYIRRFSDIFNIIIPFFLKHPILGVKSLDFADFKKVVEIVQNKEHLTSSGFDCIQKNKLYPESKKTLRIRQKVNLKYC